jgi:hypothetical protein
MLDLQNNQYSQTILKKHIYEINLLDILKTQKIDAEFAVKYLLQKKYQLTRLEELITPKIVVYYQPHLLENELNKQMLEYDSDQDSMNFEEND